MQDMAMFFQFFSENKGIQYRGKSKMHRLIVNDRIDVPQFMILDKPAQPLYVFSNTEKE